MQRVLAALADIAALRGRFIALEGIDGAGTTTQLERLAAHFGPRLHVTREPSTGPLGKEIRRHLAGPVDGAAIPPAALALLFAADRVDHLSREIVPALTRGVHVVSDRYVLSSLAYQTLGVDREHVARFNELAPTPDLTIFIDVPIDVAEGRRTRRGGPAEIFEERTLQAAVRDRYVAEIADLDASGVPVAIVDGTPAPDQVFAAVLAAVETCVEDHARHTRRR